MAAATIGMGNGAAEPATTDRFLIRADARLRYRDEGRGRPLVLVHGWALALEMWQPQVEALADRYRIIRMDRRGFGESTGTPDLESDARDLEALLDALGLERVALLGMSQGARVALSLANSAGHRIECLILDGAPADERLGLGESNDSIPLARYRHLLRSEGIAAVRRELSTLPLLRLHTTDARAHRLLHEMLCRYQGNDLREAPFSAARVEPISPDRLTMPVLVLTGELDSPQRRRTGDALCAVLPHAERATVPHAGHLANLDNPEDYNAILGDFLSRHPSTSPQPEEPP